MFLGIHRPRLDEKSRLALPARFREELTGGVVITKGQDHCLYGFTVSEFERIGQALGAGPLVRRELRAYQRAFFGSAHHDVPDRQGRVTLPAYLRAYAGLERDVVVLGANSRFEIWDAAAYDSFEAANDEQFAEFSEEVLPTVL